MLNPIVEDNKLLVVFRNIGLELLQRLRQVMGTAPYAPFFKNTGLAEGNELLFTYLDHGFATRIELFFNHSRLPQTALIATYLLPADGVREREEIVSYTFDLNFNINDIYTREDFAEHYLIELHQNIKKSFSDHHRPFPIRSNGKT